MADEKDKLSRFGSKLVRGFATNPEWSNDGKWFDHESGIRVRIARSARDTYRIALRKAFRPYRDIPGQTPPAIERKVKIQAAAAALVTDWDLGEGGPKCTELAVIDAMTEMPDFFDWVQANADTFENYRVERVEEDAGNLSGSYDGSASGDVQESRASSNVEGSAERDQTLGGIAPD